MHRESWTHTFSWAGREPVRVGGPKNVPVHVSPHVSLLERAAVERAAGRLRDAALRQGNPGGCDGRRPGDQSWGGDRGRGRRHGGGDGGLRAGRAFVPRLDGGGASRRFESVALLDRRESWTHTFSGAGRVPVRVGGPKNVPVHVSVLPGRTRGSCRAAGLRRPDARAFPILAQRAGMRDPEGGLCRQTPSGVRPTPGYH
jgi:hypothetical protein